MKIIISEKKGFTIADVVQLYKANQWSAAAKPEQLYNALLGSHTVLTAWDDKKLIGLGNAISDGHLVVYFPHLLILPEYQNKGIGQIIMEKLTEKYKEFHMQMLTADQEAISFYKKNGFEKAGNTQAMWIYKSKEH
ncbi:GNAT family N-acetyltransferase [Aquimarina sp. TRL1]|uniref:GNAT family N-acetyltransferase n=1 Tax=Aquimarina sp. (strain TRL1) TaxID=2736252 RepID=UPI001589698B|nr:GNAT family N-acetyltransferase [Aquimarina sp. TRL1]QKX05714.1 GNAT family N-acetyltransferase [Aquimarina sp. TRL1]